MKKTGLVIKNRINNKKKQKVYVEWKNIEVGDQPMSGEDITRYIFKKTGVKITRQNISQSLKSAMEKFFNALTKSSSDRQPFQVALLMMEMLCGSQTGQKDSESFFRLFPPNIREIIANDARTQFHVTNSPVILEEINEVADMH